MAFDEKLADNIREALADQKQVDEKKMFQGLCFMVNDKLCICVGTNEMMCHMNPEKVEAELEKGNCRQMVHNGKVMKGYVFVDENGYKNKHDFEHWISLCLEFNPVAKSSKKKNKTQAVNK